MNLKSTHLFPQSLSIPTPVILLAKTLQFFSNNLVTKFATKLFITPVSFPIPKREHVMFESAQKQTISIDLIQKDIQVLSYGYSAKKVLLVHGWAGRSTQMYMLADKLLEKGYMVISFDGPAHGKSTGKTTAMPEFLETITQIDKQFGPFEAAIGHSFGGMCLYNAISDGFDIKKLVTIGSGDKISDILLNFTNNLKIKPLIAKKIKQRFDTKWRVDVDLHASSIMAKKVDIPTLVVHDSNDGDVLVSNAVNIRQNLQNGRLLITRGLGHTKILRNQEVSSRIVNFITQDE